MNSWIDCGPIADPRPLEPDWVTDTTPEPSGLIEWSAVRNEWNRELKMREERKEYHEGTPMQFIGYICGVMNSPCINNVEITVDASQAAILESDCKALYLAAKIPYNYYVDWAVKYNLNNYDTDTEEYGSDPDELISWLVYVIENDGKCVVDLSDHDPTPRYAEIGSMF